jgi:predicted NBD/HSP70 family sugar kinase
MTYVVFDIGGTTTRVAVSSDGETLRETASFKTKVNHKEGMTALGDAIKKLLGNDTVTAMAGGVRGMLNEQHTAIHNDSRLEAWSGKSITEPLAERFKTEVYLENDTALAGLGEAVFGAGKGLDIIAYHTVSTGVGGVKIEKGQIDMATVGFEPGHQVLDIDRTILGEDITPTLENLVSGTAVEERMGVKPYEIPQTDALWDELAEYLAQGLRNTILYWSPEAIVLGGSMIIGDPKIELDAIRKYTVEVLDGFVDCPFITVAKLGDEAGLYGALARLRSK